jgi:hypothetical protein
LQKIWPTTKENKFRIVLRPALLNLAMKTFLTAMTMALATLGFAQSTPNVVFNELNIDNPGGGDTAEFIELYGTPGAALDGLVLVLFEGSTDDSYEAYDLDGYSLDANGFFVKHYRCRR